MALERYLQEEVAIDHADGYLSRREAIRRLAYLGLAAPATGHSEQPLASQSFSTDRRRTRHGNTH